MTQILMSWFKESTERQKELTVENADLHKAVLNKTTIHKYCVKYDFVAPLKDRWKLQCNITRIFDINSSNRMFCSMRDFISETLSLNLCHCYLKYRRL